MNELRRLRQLGEENRKLNQRVADLSQDNILIVDNHTCEFLAMEVGQSLPTDTVVSVLRRIAKQGGALPKHLQAEKESEFI